MSGDQGRGLALGNEDCLVSAQFGQEEEEVCEMAGHLTFYLSQWENIDFLKWNGSDHESEKSTLRCNLNSGQGDYGTARLVSVDF